MTNKVLGIDVSVWQDDNSTAQMMNFEKAKSKGANFVFIKASECGGVDQDFLNNWKNAKEAGLPRGAYHFLRWDLSSLLQARIFCSLLKDDPGELPPVADFEAPAKNGINPSNAILQQFLVEVENILGKRPMIYTSPGFWNSHGSADPKWTYWDLWIAQYTSAIQPMIPKPWNKWSFWQYTSNGDGKAFGAESKSLDMNWFNGNIIDFHKYLGGEVVEPNEPLVIPSNNALAALAQRVTKIENWIREF